MEPNTDEEIPQHGVRKNISSELHNALRAEAATCGTTLDAWMDTYTPGLRLKLEKQASEKNREEWNKYWGQKKADQERRAREEEDALKGSD
jgi:hypothetical protein